GGGARNRCDVQRTAVAAAAGAGDVAAHFQYIRACIEYGDRQYRNRAVAAAVTDGCAPCVDDTAGRRANDGQAGLSGCVVEAYLQVADAEQVAEVDRRGD